ncbi:hypothetical protein ACLMJF_06410, partial [Bifidobacterium adolescentis]|uniref:hypothetical protein n=1 Tax=Bifidobacterium adolescentis TaxID=1680 RepID=UPI00398CE18D
TPPKPLPRNTSTGVSKTADRKPFHRHKTQKKPKQPKTSPKNTNATLPTACLLIAICSQAQQ